MEKKEINFENIKSYLLGNFRYFLYYSKAKKLIRPHILEQIDWRIKVMNSKCYNEGSCVKCGCTTTQLQMANKSCDKPCYPPIMSKIKWKAFKDHMIVPIGKDFWRMRIQGNENPARVKITKNGMLVHVVYINIL